MKINLNLRTRRKKETPIYIILRYDGHRIVLPTKERILPDLWNEKKQRAKGSKTEPLNKRLEELNKRLDNQIRIIREVWQESIGLGERPNPESLRRQIEIKLGRVQPMAEAEAEHIESKFLSWQPITGTTKKKNIQWSGYFSTFIKNAEQRQRAGHKVSTNTIRCYKNTRTTLFHFIRDKVGLNGTLSLGEIDLSFYTAFNGYLTEKYATAPNTFGTHIKNIKAVLRDAEENGHPVNQDYKRKKFTAIQIDTPQVYLTKEELREIFTLDLSSDQRLKQVRDWFIIACRTGLRYSDLMRLDATNRIEMEGRTYFSLKTKKTGGRVSIPFHPDVVHILNQYSGATPPLIPNQKFNEGLREVCGLVSRLQTPVNNSGDDDRPKLVPKYQLVSSHTGRRTFATLGYFDGIPVKVLMRITGHTTEKQFFKYIRQTPFEDARMLSDYFNKQESTMYAVG